MTPQQRTAIAYPCRLAGETANPRYLARAGRGQSWVVTVNTGYE